tara:strand:+ start:193 stop:633 length:441 start_codon:yes stop_codon:yes gene_type:complete
MNIYTKSVILDNGIGGWAFVKEYVDGVTCMWGNSKEAIKKKDLDILCVYKACQKMCQDSMNCIIFTDSKYVFDGITKFCNIWMENGWKTKNDKSVKNVELWEYIYNVKDCLHYLPDNIESERSKMAYNLALEAANNDVVNFSMMID